ncbi:hypothetical protein EIP86_008706 [Pleurotus ostreatoroseus]|nr:hypothetical protein EIP86_008706 [Pleurotus ostreatoroseus]
MSAGEYDLESLGRIPGGHTDDFEDPYKEPILDVVKVDFDPKATRTNDDRGSERNVHDEKGTDPWKNVLDVGLEYDKELIEKWKDEMDNLLIFAGLFSAVVTAFTIESYQWLVDDPPDPSLALLTRISDQLASFSTPLGSINSTVASASSVQPSSSSSSPIASPISINTLWFLSLTLSLISAFYAIAVQQWLRQLTTPRHLRPRDAARLRQWRYDNLMAWQIPSIISVLPLLIQSAVILFLVGLLLLLHSLHHTVALAFIIVASIGMAPFIVTVILPVIFPGCPYKSPIIPSVLAIAQWCMVPFVLVATATMVIIVILVTIITVLLLQICSGSVSEYIDVATDNFIDLLSTAVMYLTMAIIPTTMGLENFWADRETMALSRKAQNPNDLDASALSQAIAISDISNSPHLRSAFNTLSPVLRTRCILYTVATTIGLRFLDLDSLFRRIVQLVHSKSNILLHDDHTNLIVETISLEDCQADDSDIPSLSLLLHLATLTDKLKGRTFFAVLVLTRARQSVSETSKELTLTQRVPTVIMCLQLHAARLEDALPINRKRMSSATIDPCSTNRVYIVVGDTVKWAVENLKFGNAILDVWDKELQKDIVKRSAKVLVRTVQMIEYILASSAVAFDTSKTVSIEEPEKDLPASLDELLLALNTFLKKARYSRIASAIRSFKSSRHDYTLFAVQESIEMLCRALADLAESDRIPLGEESQTIVTTLGDSIGSQDDYKVSKACLDRFWAAVRARDIPRPDRTGRFAGLHFPKIVAAAKKVLGSQQPAEVPEASANEATATEDPAPTDPSTFSAARTSSTIPSTAPIPTRPRLADTIRRVMKSSEYSLVSLDADVEKSTKGVTSDAAQIADTPPTNVDMAWSSPRNIEGSSSKTDLADPHILLDASQPPHEKTSRFQPPLLPSLPFGLATPDLTPMHELYAPASPDRDASTKDTATSGTDKRNDGDALAEHSSEGSG